MERASLFADSPVNRGRQIELDVVKGLAILFMLLCTVKRRSLSILSRHLGQPADQVLGQSARGSRVHVRAGSGRSLYQEKHSQGLSQKGCSSWF